MQRPRVHPAATFAVASELCRRNVVAQLNGPNCLDLSIIRQGASPLRIKVQGKQVPQWLCNGICGNDTFLVLVDFAGKRDERPDFYVLTERDWVKLASVENEKLTAKGKKMELNEQNVPANRTELVKRTREPFGYLGITRELVKKHKETWDKISSYISH